MKSQESKLFETKEKKPRAVIVGTIGPNESNETVHDTVNELEMLAKTAGYEVYTSVLQKIRKYNASTFIGSGKAKEIANIISGQGIDAIIFDDDLSPGQSKNLEKIIEKKIVDRTSIILGIFALNARTKESRTQIDLAQLDYLLPRLTGMWTHLERQIGGIGVRGGMGEKQIEVDRRIIRDRITKLKKDLKIIENQRNTQKGNRDDFFNITLVGYTNAGKSTIFNLLSNAGVLAENKLFATLDSTVRKVKLDSKNEFLLADTVGFIRKLPHSLVASFRSTLSVVQDADLLVHVIDISNPFFEDQIKAVNDVLKELGAEDKPTILVFNKTDIKNEESLFDNVMLEHPDAVLLSAKTGLGITKLMKKVDQEIESNYFVKSFKLKQNNSKLISEIFSKSSVIEQVFEGSDTIIKTKIAKGISQRITKMLSEENS